MKQINKFFLILLLFLTGLAVNAAIMQGGVSENSNLNNNILIDSQTQIPISGAKIKMPQTKYSTLTDNSGKFVLPDNIPQNTILSVEKENYKPFSLTITDKKIGKPLILSLEKSNKFDIVIDTEIYHIGDNNFSLASANAGQFRSKSVGAAYRKTFFMPKEVQAKKNYLVIGSIIGIDTSLARSMGQNNISTSYASPPQIYFNGEKIAEIHINGDNQRIQIPNYLIKPGQYNEIKIQAGVNMLQTAYVDLDDIEFMNLNIE